MHAFTLNHLEMLDFWGLKGMKIARAQLSIGFSQPFGDSVLLFSFMGVPATSTQYLLLSAVLLHLYCWWKKAVLSYSVLLGTSKVSSDIMCNFGGLLRSWLLVLASKEKKSQVQKPAVLNLLCIVHCLVKVYSFPQKSVTGYPVVKLV